MSDEENCSVLVSDRQQSALKKKKKTLQILSVNLISIQLDVGI